jgi:hypothetical protein
MSTTAYGSGTHTPSSATIASSTNATPIVITTPSAHGFSTSDTVYIVGHTTNTAANGTWVITVLSSTTFSLTGSVGNGVGGATGTVLKVVESNVQSISAAGVYDFAADLSNMLAGDVVELRVYRELKASGTLRVVRFQAFYGAQMTDDPAPPCKPFGNALTDAISAKCTIKQTFGVARAFDWEVKRYAP